MIIIVLSPLSRSFYYSYAVYVSFILFYIPYD